MTSPMVDSREANRFIGRWHAEVDHEKVFLEFLPDGRLAFTGLWGEDTKEFMGMQHPLDFGKPRTGPTWELQDSLLVIFLPPKKEFKFEYAFSEQDTSLTLRSLQSKEMLTFTKRTRQ